VARSIATIASSTTDVADRLVESVSDLDCEVAEDGSWQGIGEKKKMKS